MHERSLVKALLRQVEAIANNHVASRVLSIRVCIGEFSGVEADLLASAYDDMVQDTPLHGAVLHVEQVTLQAVCEQCGCKFRIKHFHFQCDQCGGANLTLRGGEELLLKTVQLQETEA
jgi:hydrogenase nickel incorporation protein HypA/HybF